MLKITILFLGLSLGFNSWSQTQDLSDKLMELRSQVQMEADKIDIEKNRINSKIQSLTIEKGELEATVNVLTLKTKEMSETLKKKQDLSKGKDLSDYKGYNSLILKSFEEILKNLNTVVPFKVTERSAKIEKIIEDYKNKKLTSAELINEYWLVLQRELRLAESIEVQKDTIALNNKTYKVDVLRLGTFAQYFRTQDGRVGSYMKNSQGVWEKNLLEKSIFTKEVLNIFAMRDQNIKDGFYKIPLKLDAYEVKNVL